MNLATLQDQVSIWSARNFPRNTSMEPLIGVVEEVGELCHTVLKQNQGIRSTDQGAIPDAVGDIIIYLADFCERKGIDLDACVDGAWQEVSQRDWVNYPKNGRPE